MEDLNKLLSELADIQNNLPDSMKEGDEGYGVLPADWKDQHIISCLIRNIMIIDNSVSSDEEGFMNHLIKEYTSEGTNLSDAWNDVDDYLVKLFDEDNPKYWKTIDDCENYIKQNYNDDQKNKLITGLMNMASTDDVVEYSEFTMLKSAMDKWFPGSLNQMIDIMKSNGITVITESKLPETDASEVTSDKENNWTIIHDLAVFYNYFGNLADGTMKNQEMKVISDIMPKWKFTIDNIAYGLSSNNPSSLEEVMNLAYDEMYGSDGQSDPMERVNQSHMNFVNYFNKGGILNGNIIGTFLNTLYEISNADGVISEGQDHQLRWYINQWKPVCKSAEKVEALLNIKNTQDNLLESLADQGVPASDLNDLNNDIRKESEDPDPTENQEAQKEESSIADSSEEISIKPLESSGDPVEDFRSFLASKYPTLKLPKGKKYVEFPIGKGMLVCCMVKKDGVNVYLYSGGKVPAREVFEKLNSLGVSGKVLNDKYTITPMPGSRNPNVVRIDLLVPYDGRDLNSNELRDEVNDVYSQLLELCKPLV